MTSLFKCKHIMVIVFINKITHIILFAKKINSSLVCSVSYLTNLTLLSKAMTSLSKPTQFQITLSSSSCLFLLSYTYQTDHIHIQDKYWKYQHAQDYLPKYELALFAMQSTLRAILILTWIQHSYLPNFRCPNHQQGQPKLSKKSFQAKMLESKVNLSIKLTKFHNTMQINLLISH